MKVICQQCNATYAINDAAIPPKGARAQCPRCKHLQQVKKPDGAEPPAQAPAPPPPAPPPMAARPGMPATAATPSVRPSDPFADLDLGGPSPLPAANIRSAPRPAAPNDDPFANLDLGGGAAPPPPAAPPPAAAGDPFADLDLGAPPPPPAAAPKRPNSDPFGRADGAPAAAPRPPPAAAARPVRPESDPFANLDIGGGAAPPPPAPPPAAPAAKQALGKCGTCGKLIFDPFDAALGTCESCRAKQQGEAASPAPEPKAAELPRVPVPENKPQPKPAPEKRKPTPPPKPRGPPINWTPIIGGLAVVALLGGGAFAVFKLRPAFLFPPKDTGPQIPAGLQTRVTTSWALAFPDTSGTAAEHLKSGHDHLALDRLADYFLAENEYKKAAIAALAAKDTPSLARAAAGVVEAYVLGRGEFRDKKVEAEIADDMDAALQLGPNIDSVQRANAYYLLRDGQAHLTEARSAAEHSYELAPLDGKAEALLAQGTTFLDSAQRAYDFIDRAIQSDPKLRRAYFYRGLAAERVGHYAKAIADFRKRLEIDPDARRSLIEIARVFVIVGDVAQAKSALSQVIAKDAYAYDAKVALAVIGYQLEHADRQADAQIQAVLDSETQPKEPVLLTALVHQATIAREKGDLKRATDRVEKALGIDDHYAPALFQRVLVALAANRPMEADGPMGKLVAAAPEGVPLDALQGRFSFAQNKPSEGVAHFRDALTKNPQDLRSALLGAALASKAGRSEDAYQLMTKAMEIDPTIDARHRATTDFYESKRSELSQITGGFDKEDHSLAPPIAYDGILRYYSSDPNGAEAKLKEAAGLDPACVPALVFLAQLSLDRKKFQAAQHFAEMALESERLSTLGKYLLAESDEAMGSGEEARRLYGETLAQSPGFTGAMVHLGQMLGKSGKTDDAQAMLLKVFFADPDDTDACSALFKLGY